MSSAVSNQLLAVSYQTDVWLVADGSQLTTLYGLDFTGLKGTRPGQGG